MSCRTLATSFSPRICSSLPSSTSPLPPHSTRQCAIPLVRYATNQASRTDSSSFKRKGQGDKLTLFEKRMMRPRVFEALKPLPPKSLENPIFEDKSEIDSLVTLQKARETFTKEKVGSLVQFKTERNGVLATFGMPLNILVEFRLLSKPYTVVRSATKSLVERLNLAKTKSSLQTRLVLTGSMGTGKSVLMLQAASQALADGWIVLYIPRANKLIDSSTAYRYDSNTQIYMQSNYSHLLLKRFRDVNASLLHSIKLSNQHTFDKSLPVKANSSLREAIDVALRDMNMAPYSLIAALDEVGRQTQHPVLFAVDNFQALYCKSDYRNTYYHLIEPYHLSAPRLILEYASGRRSFARGAFLGALSMQNTQHPLRPELQQSLELPEEHPTPYDKRYPERIKYAEGLRAYPVPEKLGHAEATAIFELWTKDKALHTLANDELFLSKYSEAAGNPRDFVYRGLLTALQT